MFCGGQGIYLYYLSRELARAGHNVHVLVGPPYPSPLPWAHVHRMPNLNLWGVRRGFLPKPNPLEIFYPLNFLDFAFTRFGFFPEMLTFSIRAFLLLKKLHAQERFHLIHDIQCLGYGLLLIKALHIPVVSTVHHPLSIDRRMQLERDLTPHEIVTTLAFYPIVMQRIVIRNLNLVITSSHNGVRELQSAFGLKAAKVRVVYNGLDTDFYQKRQGVAKVPQSLLFVGNCDDRKKGVIYLLQALLDLPKNITLTLVDDDWPLRLEIPKLVTKMGLRDRVRFTGKVSNEALVELYSSHEIVVSPSLHEGFGLPAAEAMSCQTPVIAARAGALPEVIEDNVTGILVEPRDPKGLAEAIKHLLSNPAKRREMGERGRERAVKLFSWKIAARNTMGVYRELV